VLELGWWIVFFVSSEHGTLAWWVIYLMVAIMMDHAISWTVCKGVRHLRKIVHAVNRL